MADEMMANIAVVFHWPPDVIGEMTTDELIRWHDKALARAPKGKG